MEEMTMGKRIMALRKQKGLTQEQLAERVSVSPQAVSKWENDVSCPDIAIIPRLAEVLDVTTDELLGVKPVEPRVVVVDSGSGEKKHERSYSFHFDGDRRSGIIFALVAILVGAVFLLSRANLLPFSPQFNLWGIVWPAVVLGLGVSWTVKDLSPFPVGVALLGLYYLLYNLGAVTFALTWNTIWPIALILLGLTILIDKLFPRRKSKWDWKNHAGDDHTPVTEYTDTNGYVRYENAFTDDARKVNAEVFQGGSLDVSFGKSVLDLTACKSLQPGARLAFDVSFASLEILMPRCFQIANAADKSFGSITTRGEASPDAAETLQLSGDVSFGSLIIRYV